MERHGQRKLTCSPRAPPSHLPRHDRVKERRASVTGLRVHRRAVAEEDGGDAQRRSVADVRRSMVEGGVARNVTRVNSRACREERLRDGAVVGRAHDRRRPHSLVLRGRRHEPRSRHSDVERRQADDELAPLQELREGTGDRGAARVFDGRADAGGVSPETVEEERRADAHTGDCSAEGLCSVARPRAQSEIVPICRAAPQVEQRLAQCPRPAARLVAVAKGICIANHEVSGPSEDATKRGGGFNGREVGNKDGVYFDCFSRATGAAHCVG